MTARLESPWSRPMDASLSYVTPAGVAGAITVDGTGLHAAVDAFTVRWARPAGYAQPNPGELTLTLLQALDVAPLPYGSRISLHLTDGLDTVDAGLGWLTSYTRTAISGDRQLVKITLEDSLSRAANIRLQASPWPAEEMAARLARINAASPLGDILDLADLGPGLTFPAIGAGILAPRDVDNASALDIIRRSIPFGWTIGETSDGLLRPWKPEGSRLAWSSTSPLHASTAWLSQATPVRIPLDAIEDPRTAILDRAGLMTHCAVEFRDYVPGGPDLYPDSSHTFTAAGPTADLYTASVYSTSTDLSATDTFDGYEAIIARAELLVAANAAPVERWPAQRVALSRLTSSAALAMVSLPRHAAGLIILGEYAGPAFQVLAGVLGYSQGMAALTVELADARQALVTPLEFAQIPTRDLNYSPGGSSLAFPQLFKNAGTVTFDSTSITANHEEWKAWI